jgi:hypothetical protein
MTIIYLVAAVAIFSYLRNKGNPPCPGCDQQPNVITSVSQSGGNVGDPTASQSFFGAIEAALTGFSGSGGYSVLGSGGNGSTATSGGGATGTTSGGGGTQGGGGGAGGGVVPYSCFTPNTRIKIAPDKFAALSSFISGDLQQTLYNLSGFFEFKLIEHEHNGPIIKLPCGGVTLEHPMTRDGNTNASRYYANQAAWPRVPYVGKVYDICVVTRDEAAMHFILENGDVAHNKPISQ